MLIHTIDIWLSAKFESSGDAGSTRLGVESRLDEVVQIVGRSSASRLMTSEVLHHALQLDRTLDVVVEGDFSFAVAVSEYQGFEDICAESVAA